MMVFLPPFYSFSSLLVCFRLYFLFFPCGSNLFLSQVLLTLFVSFIFIYVPLKNKIIEGRLNNSRSISKWWSMTSVSQCVFWIQNHKKSTHNHKSSNYTPFSIIVVYPQIFVLKIDVI
jgi:hypothetical protein